MMIAKSQSAEDRIKNYLLGFEKKDWEMVANQFADGFTFTSPAGDDHFPLRNSKRDAGQRLSSLKRWNLRVL